MECEHRFAEAICRSLVLHDAIPGRRDVLCPLLTYWKLSGMDLRLHRNRQHSRKVGLDYELSRGELPRAIGIRRLSQLDWNDWRIDGSQRWAVNQHQHYTDHAGKISTT